MSRSLVSLSLVSRSLSLSLSRVSLSLSLVSLFLSFLSLDLLRLLSRDLDLFLLL